MKRKILLFGPFEDFGGRELEASFIASVLSTQYDVEICTSSIITKKSQLFEFDKKQKLFSVKELVSRKYLMIRFLAVLSYFKNSFKGSVSDYSNNIIAKRCFGYYNKVNSILEEIIPNYDLIFICAQLSSALINEIIDIAKVNNKQVLFRTTGAIIDIDFEFINKVDFFLHHSVANAQKLASHKKHNFDIIDQCAFDEGKLLKIPHVTGKAKTFLTVSRLVKEKNVDIVIRAFQEKKKIGDKLYVVGDGPEFKNLVKIAEGDQDIIFTGFVANNDLHRYFLLADCVIISYYKLETGPLTGIEAMAASRVIISARTGAMEERLPFNKFWFDISKLELMEHINSVMELDSNQLFEISKKNRDAYLQEYSIERIKQKYLDVVHNALA